MKADPRAAEYLDQVLRLDSVDEAASILALRARFVRPSGGRSRADRPPRERDGEQPDRNELRDALVALRDELWELDERAFDGRAAALDVRAFPDLARRLERLRELSALRDQLAAAEASPRVDTRFLLQLREIAAATPREAVALKSQGLEALRDRAPHRKACGSVKYLRRRFPAVHALEPEWLDQVLRARRTFKLSRRPRQTLMIFGVVWVIITIVKIVSRIFGSDG